MLERLASFEIHVIANDGDHVAIVGDGGVRQMRVRGRG